MNRRQMLGAAALALAAPGVLAAEAAQVEYTRERYERLLASGEPFLLDFYAPW